MESGYEHAPHKHHGHLNAQLGLQIARQVLLKDFRNGPMSSNLVFSPLSLHVVLSLIASGSAGRTLDQLLSFLGSKSLDDLNLLSSRLIKVFGLLSSSNEKGVDNILRGPVLSFVNSTWVDKRFPLKPSFHSLSTNTYKAEAKEVDFVNKADEASKEINSWVQHATKDLIKELIPSGSIDGNTTLILVNALYFKGAWDRKFDTSKTQVKDFHLLNGESTKVPFMTTRSDEKHLYRSAGEGFRILKVPYQNNFDARKFSMYFFLPDQKDGLEDLIEMFDSDPELMNLPLYEETLHDLWVPRFKFSYTFEASKTLKELGLNLPFMNMGELTEMIKSPFDKELCLSEVFHKSYIEVNEEGTEAAASTAAIFRWCCAVYPTPCFVADHPFMFVIKEETSESVIFMGIVLNPLAP